ncbi:MAG TPA: hypothetical protein VMZ31_17640 [Phycisphaerae bacterium]|nr:hypothetical protein [Phycisphaerae bacterium]
MQMRWAWKAVSCAALALLLCAGCSIPPEAAFRHEAEPVETSADFAGCRRFEADLRDAELTIEGWDQPTVKVTARVWAKAYLPSSAKRLAETAEVKLARDGDKVTLVCRPTKPMWGNEQVRASLLVYLPTDASVDVASQHGSVAATAVRGQVCAESEYGSITLNQPEGAVRCETRYGNIRISEAQTGQLDCSTVYGHIEVLIAPGCWQGETIDLKTCHGKIELKMETAGEP